MTEFINVIAVHMQQHTRPGARQKSVIATPSVKQPWRVCPSWCFDSHGGSCGGVRRKQYRRQGAHRSRRSQQWLWFWCDVIQRTVGLTDAHKHSGVVEQSQPKQSTKDVRWRKHHLCLSEPACFVYRRRRVTCAWMCRQEHSRAGHQIVMSDEYQACRNSRISGLENGALEYSLCP